MKNAPYHRVTLHLQSYQCFSTHIRYSLSKAQTIKKVILTGKEAKVLDQTENMINNHTNDETEHDQEQNINKNYKRFLEIRQTSCRLKTTNHRCTSMCTYRSVFSQKELAEMRLMRLNPFSFIPTIWGSTPNSGRELGELSYGRKKGVVTDPPTT